MKVFRFTCLFSLLLIQHLTLAQGDSPPEQETPDEIATRQLMETISSWAGAWQSQLPDLYISHYTLDYMAPGFSTREAWVADRRARIMEPDYIKLRLLDFELVAISETEATTHFTLIYERPDYSDETYKELIFSGQHGFWLIKAENNLQVKSR